MYIKESLAEENAQNVDIVHLALSEMMSDFLELEWLEEFAEEELVQYKIDEVRKDLPVHLQREIFNRDKHIIYSRVAELVYFGILNDFVGGFWTIGITKSAVQEELSNSELSIEDIFILKDPTIKVEEIKRSQPIKPNSQYQR